MKPTLLLWEKNYVVSYAALEKTLGDVPQRDSTPALLLVFLPGYTGEFWFSLSLFSFVFPHSNPDHQDQLSAASQETGAYKNLLKTPDQAVETKVGCHF